MKQLLEAESKRERQRYLMRDAYERKPQTADYGNSNYEGRGERLGMPVSGGADRRWRRCQKRRANRSALRVQLAAQPPQPNSYGRKNGKYLGLSGADRACGNQGFRATIVIG